MMRFFVVLRKFFEFLQCKKLYRSHPVFQGVDGLFQKLYRGKNPYTICRKYFEKTDIKDPHVYGETPLKVFEELAKRLKIGPKDVFLDLGCGRGRGVFFMSALTGCKGIGIDIVPEFIALAGQLVLSLQGILNVHFLCQNLNEAELPYADIVYIAGTCFDEGLIETLESLLKRGSSHLKVVTVSEPLQGDDFQVIERFPATFFWGKTDIYIQKSNK